MTARELREVRSVVFLEWNLTQAKVIMLLHSDYLEVARKVIGILQEFPEGLAWSDEEVLLFRQFMMALREIDPQYTILKDKETVPQAQEAYGYPRYTSKAPPGSFAALLDFFRKQSFVKVLREEQYTFVLFDETSDGGGSSFGWSGPRPAGCPVKIERQYNRGKLR